MHGGEKVFISDLEYQLIERMATEIYNKCNIEIITEDDISTALEDINKTKNENKYEFCSSLETLYYIYSVILSEVRQKKRELMSLLFESNPKLAQEKSVLKEKLDADPDYAILHNVEELLFQFTEHIQNVKNSVVYMFKDGENPLE